MDPKFWIGCTTSFWRRSNRCFDFRAGEGQGEILVSASLGISTLEEKVGIETLFNLADCALAEAQKEGGDYIKISKD